MNWALLRQMEDREVTVLLLGLAVAAFVVWQLPRIRSLPYWGMPVAAAALLLTGWFLSTVEVYLSGSVDVLEHGAYAAHSLTMALWTLFLYRSKARAC